MGKLVSFDISSDFGFFKKPDINKFCLTYNLPPKPAILGILGSILGMKGLNQQYEENRTLEEVLKISDALTQNYNKAKRLVSQIDFNVIKEGFKSLDFKKQERLIELLDILKKSKEKDFESYKEEFKEIINKLKSELQYPEYYSKLKHLKIGIKPLGDFPFNKVMNKYNSKNSYFGGAKYENVLISEQLLIKPMYRIYVYEEGEGKILAELMKRIKNKNPVFMPYLGKNEFIIVFENIKIIEDAELIKPQPKYKISSIFLRKMDSVEELNEEEGKTHSIDHPMRRQSVTVLGLPQGFIFVEHYPVGYSDVGMQYYLQLAEYTERWVETSSPDLERGILIKIGEELIYFL